MVMNVLKSLNSWLQENQTGDEISYETFREILDNSAKVSQDSAALDNVVSFDRAQQYRNELWTSCQANIHFNFFFFLISLSSLAFIGFSSGLSITYCIEEEHECKLRERVDFRGPQ